MTVDKLSIGYEMAQFDAKNRDFFDNLSPEEQKKFSPYLMIRWGSAVKGSPELQAYYLMSANERLNKNFFDISTTEHKKFQWLLATTVSPGLGKQYHEWIAPKKKTNNNKAVKFFRQLYPHLKEEDLELLGKLNSKDDIKQLARQHGWDDKRIKDEL
jgi:hypothetical protein